MLFISSMPPNHGLSRIWRSTRVVGSLNRVQKRGIQYDGRNRLSNFWTPTQTRKKTAEDEGEDGHDLLVRAGFLRQAHSGIFHLLPLGLRVQDKIERLIDKHMQSLGASKVSLSSLSSQDLWEKSGRLDGRNAELFQLEDRKEAKYLLAPTHEEEITTIVGNAVQSYKDLPLRLYQVSRKYRDEARPRQGLLRGREFVMKDLYTFDVTESKALETYEAVRAAYRAFLDELNLPYLVATADSGNMGGNHSHEYHFPSSKGEDTILNCTGCGMTINEELYRGRYDADHFDSRIVGLPDTRTEWDKSRKADVPFQVWYGWRPQEPVREEKEEDDEEVEMKPPLLVEVYFPKGPFEPNLHGIKGLVPGLDTSQSSDIEVLKAMIRGKEYDEERLALRDPRVPWEAIASSEKFWSAHPLYNGPAKKVETAPFLLTRPRHDDLCPSCGTSGSLKFQEAVEIGHTFHLGKRYSSPLEATIMDEKNKQVQVEMGCHGIGVSRLVGAVASLLVDDKGLNWPKAIAPFSVVLVGAGNTSSEVVTTLYDYLNTAFGGSSLDVAIDDRQRPFGWKLNDADLIGYPFIVVLGKAWSERQAVELQCRRLGVKEEVSLEDVVAKLRAYSEKL